MEENIGNNRSMVAWMDIGRFYWLLEFFVSQYVEERTRSNIEQSEDQNFVFNADNNRLENGNE